MRKLTILIALLFITPIQANDNAGYIGIQYADSNIDIDGVDDVDLTAGLLRIGITTPEGYSFEFRTGRGTNDDNIGPIEVEIERIGGFYGLYHYSIGETLTAYPIIGWSEVTLKASNSGQSTQEDENGFSYGVGIESHGVNIEWMQYLNTSEVEASAISVGYNYYFE